MGKRLSSPRFRRRVFWVTAAGLLAGAVAGAVMLLPSSKPKPQVFTKTPPQVIKEPHPVKLDNKGRAEVVFAASSFIQTAVRRRHVAASWDMTDPSLRSGFTKRRWATGNIPVVPYPAAGIRQLQFDWTYQDDVAMDIVLVPVRGSALPLKSFTIELKRSGAKAQRRWRVSSWAPQGVSESSMIADATKTQGAIPSAIGLSTKWLLLPLFLVLGTIVLLPLYLAVRERTRVARAEKEHRRATGS